MFIPLPAFAYNGTKGTGFRLMAKPYVVGRVDFAHGRDGFNEFIGLDYPF